MALLRAWLPQPTKMCEAAKRSAEASSTAIVAEIAPTAVVAAAAGLPAGWCKSPGGFPVTPGEYVDGSERRICQDGVDQPIKEGE